MANTNRFNEGDTIILPRGTLVEAGEASYRVNVTKVVTLTDAYPVAGPDGAWIVTWDEGDDEWDRSTIIR